MFLGVIERLLVLAFPTTAVQDLDRVHSLDGSPGMPVGAESDLGAARMTRDGDRAASLGFLEDHREGIVDACEVEGRVHTEGVGRAALDGDARDTVDLVEEREDRDRHRTGGNRSQTDQGASRELFHQLDLARSPGLVEPRLGRAIETQNAEPPLAGEGLGLGSLEPFFEPICPVVHDALGSAPVAEVGKWYSAAFTRLDNRSYLPARHRIYDLRLHRCTTYPGT